MELSRKEWQSATQSCHVFQSTTTTLPVKITQAGNVCFRAKTTHLLGVLNQTVFPTKILHKITLPPSRLTPPPQLARSTPTTKRVPNNCKLQMCSCSALRLHKAISGSTSRLGQCSFSSIVYLLPGLSERPASEPVWIKPQQKHPRKHSGKPRGGSSHAAKVGGDSSTDEGYGGESGTEGGGGGGGFILGTYPRTSRNPQARHPSGSLFSKTVPWQRL